MKQVHYIVLLTILITELHCQALKSWNPAITEIIKQESDSSQACSSDNCRPWNSIRNIAMCKAGQLQQLLDTELPDHTLFYTETSSKDLQEQGWSKFLFSVISAHHQDRTHMVKVCVPTAKVANAWVSGLCVWQPCGEVALDEECQKKLEGAGQARFKQIINHQQLLNNKQKVNNKKLLNNKHLFNIKKAVDSSKRLATNMKRHQHFKENKRIKMLHQRMLDKVRGGQAEMHKVVPQIGCKSL